MAVSLVVGLTRGEEESGRAELTGSGAVDRRAPVATALLVAAVALLGVAVVVTAVLGTAGFAVADSAALAAGVALTGLVLAGVAAVTGQLAEHARTASGVALGVLAVAVVVRGVGDLLHTGGSALSWFSPIAWAQQTRPFVDLRWWPLLLPVALVGVLVRIAYALAGRRDLGAGVFLVRPGPAAASRWLSGTAALTARLQRGALAGWATGLVLLGATFGSLADEVAGMLAGNARLTQAFATAGASLPDSFFAAVGRYLAIGVAAFGIGSVLRLRGEETAGRVELVLSAAVGRGRLLGTAWGVAAAGCTVLALGTGLGTALAAAASRGDATLVGPLLGGQLAYLPAVLLTLAVAALLVGWLPRLAGLAWALLTWELVAALFGPLLQLPGWALRLSPFGWGAAVPAEPFDGAAAAGLGLLALGVLGAALAGIRRRDLPA
jgi:ABC-2 type transport system permease protein